MVALQIRDVPDDVRDALAGLARSRGQSLQGFLLSLVLDTARRSANAALLASFDHRSDGSRMSVEEAIDTMENETAERDSEVDVRKSDHGGVG